MDSINTNEMGFTPIPEDPYDSSSSDDYGVPENGVVVELNDTTSNTDDHAVSEMNLYFLMREKIYTDTLSPQLVLNEEKKRTHKDIVVGKLFSILKWQFIATYIFTFILIVAIVFGGYFKTDSEMLKYMFDFLKFYITSILAELIAILFFIVKQVFDKSIFELFKNFDKNVKNDD